METLVEGAAIKVLLAEDEELCAASIRDVLESRGYTVVGDAADGDELMRMVKTLQPDIVLMDISMPGMNGIEATKQLQKTSPTPVVILSAYQSDSLIKEAREAGAGAYAIKPPDGAELDRCIQIAIKRHQELMDERLMSNRLSRAVIAREQILDSVFEAIQDMICMVDSEYRLVMSNLKPGPGGEREFETCHERIMNRPSPCGICPAREVFATKAAVEMELENPADGKMYHVRATPKKNMEGRVEHVVIHLRDVTKKRNAQKRVQVLLKQLLTAQEKERLMVASELHDNVAQNLAAARLSCKMLIHQKPGIPPAAETILLDLSRLIDQSVEDIRSIAYEIHPPRLNDIGFDEAVRRLCDDFSHRAGIKMDNTISDLSGFRFSKLHMLSLYRLVQEALNNIQKHARADHIFLNLAITPPDLVLHIADNGAGFDTLSRINTAAGEKRMGLVGMRERTELLNGQWRIESEPGKGTAITIAIPVKEMLDDCRTDTADH